MRRLLSFLFALALAVEACGSFSAGPPDGTVTGTVTVSPCSPVQRAGDSPCPPRPGLVVSFRPVDGGAVQTARTDQSGIYWIDLPAGGYEASAAGGIIPAAAQRVTVKAGATITVNFAVDSGIR